MFDRKIWMMAWALLDQNERRNAWIVLGIVVIGALSSALMVGSILPFLSVLADPDRIDSVPILAWAYDTFGFTSQYSFLIGLGVASTVVILLASLIQILKTWAVSRFSLMRMHTLSHRLLAAYMRQPYEFFLDRHTGEMGTRILAETGQVVNQFFKPAADLVASALSVLAIVALLLWAEPVVAIVAFMILGGLYGAVYALSRRVLKRQGQIRVAANSGRFRIANEALGGIKDIKLLGREGAYVQQYSQPSRKMAVAMVAVQVISQVPQFALQAIAFGGIIVLCLLLMDPEGLATGTALAAILPVLGLFAFAGQRLMPELSRLYRSLAILQAGRAAVEVIHADLEDRLGSGDALPKVLPAPMGLKRQISLENVSYRYPSADHAGVSEVKLEISAGERVGLVGGTGAGKTTLADIMLGLLTPGTGQILIDDKPVTQANLRAWQQSVGYVPQDIFLTDSSVAENVALGVPPQAIDQARVEKAARIAQLDTFIRTDLPLGYATMIGERGVRLSGGQRQRIGIARAMYHDADFVVFDEATSALDTLTEAEVMSAIEALPGEKTVLIIAHRLSTVKHCDRIILLDKGRVAGMGNWAELEARSAKFRSMVAGMTAA